MHFFEPLHFVSRNIASDMMTLGKSHHRQVLWCQICEGEKDINIKKCWKIKLHDINLNCWYNQAVQISQIESSSACFLKHKILDFKKQNKPNPVLHCGGEDILIIRMAPCRRAAKRRVAVRRTGCCCAPAVASWGAQGLAHLHLRPAPPPPLPLPPWECHLARAGKAAVPGQRRTMVEKALSFSLCPPSKCGWKGHGCVQARGAGEQMEQVHHAVGDY